MTCDPRHISYYRDGALSFDERYELEDHLRECAECSAQLRGLMRLAGVVRSLPMVPVSPALRDDVYRLVAAQEQEKRQPITFGSFGRALAPATVAAAIAVSALVAFRPGALDLANRPAPAAQTVQAPSGSTESPPVAQQAPASQAAPVPASSAAGSTGASSSASLPKTGIGSQPPRLAPVAEGNNGSLPIKIADPAAVPGPIARLYTANQQVRDLLGEAKPGSRTVTLLEQSFQGGLAILRGDTRQVYVLQRDGTRWSVHNEMPKPNGSLALTSAPQGAMLPSGGFVSVWRSNPEIQSRLGWAVYESRGSGGTIQVFERGLVVWTPHGLLYVLSDDGRWRTFPDATPI